MNYCSHPYKEVKTNMEVDHVLLLNLNQNINRFFVYYLHTKQILYEI